MVCVVSFDFLLWRGLLVTMSCVVVCLFVSFIILALLVGCFVAVCSVLVMSVLDLVCLWF